MVPIKSNLTLGTCKRQRVTLSTVGIFARFARIVVVVQCISIFALVTFLAPTITLSTACHLTFHKFGAQSVAFSNVSTFTRVTL